MFVAFENNRVTCSDLFPQYDVGVSFIIFLKKSKLYKTFALQRIYLIIDRYHLEILFRQNCCVMANHLNAVEKFSSIHDAMLSTLYLEYRIEYRTQNIVELTGNI